MMTTAPAAQPQNRLAALAQQTRQMVFATFATVLSFAALARLI